MAELRFLVHHRSRLVEPGPDTAYLSGMDSHPWPCVWHEDAAGISLTFSEEDSPRFTVQTRPSADAPGGAFLALSTATLQARSQPYTLWLELARGTVDRLRNRVANFDAGGCEVSPEVNERVLQCSRQFCDAVMLQNDLPACELQAMAVIDAAQATIEHAMRDYLEWLRALVAQDTTVHPTLRGTWFPGSGDQPRPQALESLVNTVVVRPDWPSLEPSPGQWHWDSLDAAIQAANERQWNVALGPILSFDPARLPAWLLKIDDATSLRKAVQRYVVQVMERVASQIDLCLLVGSINFAPNLPWDGSTRLQLILDAGAAVRQVVDNLPFVVGVRQPFAESQPRGSDYPALHLADALIRANLELCGFALEIDFGTEAGQTWPRDLTQLWDRLAQWGMFGLPLLVCTSADADAATPGGTTSSLDMTLWLELLDVSPLVHAVFWSDPVHQNSHHRGLFDREGHETEAAKWLRTAFRLPEHQDRSVTEDVTPNDVGADTGTHDTHRHDLP